MAEYIEREAALNKLCRDNCGNDYNGKCYNCYTAAFIEQYQAADVAPVVRGKWNILTECANEGVYCSVCHKKVYRADYARCANSNKLRSNYCPNCGARMDGE